MIVSELANLVIRLNLKMIRKVPARIAFVCLIVVTLFTLTACVSAPKLKPGEPLTQELIDAYNQAATDAMSKPKPRSPSGSKEPSVIARSAVLKYDRQHVHLFNQRVRQLNYDYYHRYISATEWHRRYTKLFVDRGVIPNRRYRGKKDLYILKLKGDHRLDDASIEILKQLHKRWWTAKDLSVPRIQIANNKSRSRGVNYQIHDLTIIDPPSLHLYASRLLLDKNEAVRAVALHEAAHAVHAQLLGQDRYRQLKGKLKVLSDAAGGWTNFRSAGEVIEFLADAVEVQLGATAVQLVASRLVRPGGPIGSLKKAEGGKTEILRYRHDASALFMQRLIIQLQQRAPPSDSDFKIVRFRKGGQANANKKKLMLPDASWMKSQWVPFTEETFTQAAVKEIQDEYAIALDSIISVFLGEDT